MDLETYGRITGTLHGLDSAEHDAVFAREGISRARYDAAWGAVAQRMSGNAEAVAAYTAAFRRGLETVVGPVRDLTEDEFRAAEVQRRLERPADTAELSAPAFLVAQYRFSDRLMADKREASRMEASVQLATQEALGGYVVRPLPPPRLATRVRARRCPTCHAPKWTAPRTPQVYCDFCGGLMDYDYEAARVTTQGIDPTFVTTLLIDGVRDELRQAREAGDDDAWSEAWRWVYATDMDLCPEGWSPRIRQPAFREALIAWSVQTCWVANEPEIKAANARAAQAWERGSALNGGWSQVPEKKRRRGVLAHLEASDAALEVQIRRYEELGLFDSHPDGLTPETFRRTHRGGLVDLWRAWLDDEMLALVRAHVDGAESWVDVPPPELHRSTCGGCGGPLAVVEGSRALICEGCGVRLDAERPRFACPSCAAAVVVVPDAHEISCAHCSAVFLPG